MSIVGNTGEIQNDLGMHASAVSHHLEKLKIENLVQVSTNRAYERFVERLDQAGVVDAVRSRDEPAQRLADGFEKL